MRMIEVDGSQGEGGGQMMRSAIALSALTGKPTRVFNIRSNRPNPGLSPQHLTAVQGVAAQCGAEMEGAEVGSTELTFTPGEIGGGSYRLDVGTAGSTTLVLQACLLPAIRANGPTRFEISGGTNVRWSPPVDYYAHVLIPHLKSMGVKVGLKLIRRGFYPEGGGKIEAEIWPSKRILPLALSERMELRRVGAVCFLRNLPEHVCKRICRTIRKEMIDYEDLTIARDEGEGPSTGAGVLLYAEYENTILGADGLGERGIPAEKVASQAVDELLEEMRGPATLDVHATDQLLPYMAMANGPSVFLVRRLTDHLTTQMSLIPLFLNVSFFTERLEMAHRVTVVPIHT